MEPRPTPALTRLDPASRSDGVFERLRSQVLMRAFPGGSRLPTERELATTLGVNRASVREAVRRLEALELVTVRHGQGIFVGSASTSSALQVVEALLRDPRTVTSDLLRQILVFRRDVSIRVVELAAVTRTSEQVERGRALLAAIEARDASEARRIVEVMLDYSEQAILATTAQLEADGVIGPNARRAGA